MKLVFKYLLLLLALTTTSTGLNSAQAEAKLARLQQALTAAQAKARAAQADVDLAEFEREAIEPEEPAPLARQLGSGKLRENYGSAAQTTAPAKGLGAKTALLNEQAELLHEQALQKVRDAVRAQEARDEKWKNASAWERTQMLLRGEY